MVGKEIMGTLRQRFASLIHPPGLAGVLSRINREIDDTIRDRKSIRPLLDRLDRSRKPIEEFFGDHIEFPVAARALTVKVLNLCLARYHFLGRTTAVLSRPYGLVVDPINNCNLACPGCVHSARSKELELFQWNSGMLSQERYTALLSRYGPYAIQITLCNYGEPLMNPATPGFIRRAKSYLATTTLSTNMTAKKFDAEAYVLSGLDYMTLSIDGATQGVYEKYRRKGDIDQIFRNIRSLVEARSRLGKGTPIVSWQFLAFEHNAHEIEAATAMARELGVDQIDVTTPFDVSWDDPGVRPAAVKPVSIPFHQEAGRRIGENWNPFPEALDATAIDAAFHSGWLEQLALQPETDFNPGARSDHMCHWLYKNMVMDATGRVLPCCAAPRPDADLVFDRFQIESADSFNTEKYRLARLSFADKEAYATARAASGLAAEPHCANCDWYSDQQAALIGGPQIEKYLRIAGNGLFDAESLRILSSC
jgi:MoaA/NifB/PqqE/SkfB family radical SAM enzyme